MFILFMCSALFVWFVYFYDEHELSTTKNTLVNSIIENDYVFLVEHTSKKKWRKLYRDRVLYSIIISVTISIFADLNKFFLICIFVAIYLLQYQLLKRNYLKKLELAKLEFPFLLDKIAGLIQINTVPVAIYKSLDDSPRLFEDDLKKLVVDIHKNGDSILPYLSFSNKFHQVEDIESIMRTLYSLSEASGNRESIISSFCNLANEKIRKRKEIDYENKIDSLNFYSYSLYAAMGLLVFSLFTAMNFFKT